MQTNCPSLVIVTNENFSERTDSPLEHYQADSSKCLLRYRMPGNNNIRFLKIVELIASLKNDYTRKVTLYQCSCI